MNIGKTFIERLSIEQIDSFIAKYYLNQEYCFDYGYANGFPSIIISIGPKYNPHSSRSTKFYDFYAEEHLIGWTHFLYKIFGEEYEKAFVKHYLE